MLVDTHCHLASYRYQDDEILGLVESAQSADVERLISIGTDLEDCRRNLEIIASHPNVFTAVGIHPTSTPDLKADDWLDQVRAMTAHDKVLAIGEIGLDFYHPAPEPLTEDQYRSHQEEVFRAQLDLAAELDLPVVIHQRNSYHEILEVMAPYHGKVRAVFHCFVNTTADALNLIDHGHLVSFTGIATYKNAPEVQEAARDLPLDKIMVETDAPYLSPVPHRGKRCEPAFTRNTAEHIANLRGISFEEFAQATTQTAQAFFNLP
ncbi:MAG: TatD family hydrolase [Verrucomicrobiota bacterium]